MADAKIFEAGKFAEREPWKQRLGKLALALGLGFALLLAQKTLAPTSRPGGFGFRSLRECFDHGIFYGTPDMGKGIIMASAEACQKKCANSAGCMRFSFWPDGRCLLTDVESEPQASPHTISGPALCPEHLGEEPTVQTGARLRGQRGDAGGFGPDGPWQDYHPYDPPDNDGLSRRLGSGLRHLQESKSPTPEAQKVPSEATAKTGAAHPSGQNNDDEGFGPNGPWQDYDPYDPPDNDGLSRRLGSGLRHLQESKSPAPEAQKVPSEATAKTGAVHSGGQNNDDEGFGPNGPWQDYDPYDPPDNDGLSRRLGSGLRHLQESKSPAPEAQKVPSEAAVTKEAMMASRGVRPI